MSSRSDGSELSALLSAIVEDSDDAIVSKTLDGVITSWNRGAERIFGYSAAEAVGRSILLIIPPDRHAEEQHVLAMVRRGEKVDHFQTVRIAKDGRRVPISLTVSPVRNSEGKIVGASKIARDISAQVALEAERDALLAAAHADSRRKDDFLAMIAHELRNPLAAISTATDLLELTIGPSDIHARPVTVIKRQLTQLRRLVDDLLDASRVRTGKIVLERRVVNLAEAVQRALAVIQSAEPRPRQSIQVSCVDVGVSADPVRLEQILLNLLSNAVKFTPAGKRIEVSVSEQGEQAVLRVADEGMGIAADALPRIFDLFVQSDRSREHAGGGLGIGLSLVRVLTELHGGTVQAESEGPGRGAVFTVRLPCVPRITESEAPPPSLPAAPARRVLIVEDHADVREMLREFLHRRGHEVFEAADGVQAIELVSRLRPEVLLVDIGLPVMDGFELARRVRAQTVQPKRLIALTGYGQPEDRERCLAAGFDDYILKPIDVHQLATLLEGLSSSERNQRK